MQVWIGFKQNEEYVHEWTGEFAQEEDVGQHWKCNCRLSNEEWQGHLGNKARELPDRHATA